MHLIKKAAIDGPLVIWWWSAEGVEAFHGPTHGLTIPWLHLTLREPMSLGYEIHRDFSVLSGTGWQSGLELGSSLLLCGRLKLAGIWRCLSPKSVRLSLHPTRLSLIKQFHVRAGLTEKNRVLWCVSDDSFSLPHNGSRMGFFSTIYWQNLVKRLELKLPWTGSLWSFSPSELSK